MAAVQPIALTQGGPITMTAEEFAARVETLIADAREAGMSDEAMIGVLHDAAKALQKGLS